MRENEKGSIVVETVGSFMFFVFLMVSIITLINITTVQARVHYAITQTANELAMYSYVIHALGLSEAAMSRDANAGAVEGQINSVINDINTIQSGVSGGSGGVADILGNLNTVIDAIGNLTTSAGSAASNPQAILFALVQYGLSPVMDGMMQEVIVRPMIAKHLQVGGLDADAYLRAFNVVDGLDGIAIHESSFITSGGAIIIVAEFEVDYTFGLLSPLPGDIGTLTIRQTAMTRAWLGGVSN